MTDLLTKDSSDTSSDSAPATLTAEPPQPPSSPPATGVANPPRKRGCGWVVWLLVVLALIACGAFGAYWYNTRVRTVSVTAPERGTSPYSMAMAQAHVSAPNQPGTPVPLSDVHAAGSHKFDATFTYPQITALMQSFAPPPGTQQVEVKVDSLTAADNGALKLTGTVSSGGSSYSGSIWGPVTYTAGKLIPSGDFTANVGGIEVSGGQANQAADSVLSYYSAFIAAAPGLHIDTAVVQAGGVHVTGTAPDTISW